VNVFSISRDLGRGTRPRSEGSRQLRRIENRWRAGESRAHHGKRSLPRQRGKIRNRLRQCRRKILGNGFRSVEPQNRGIQAQRICCRAIQFCRHLVAANHNDLRMRMHEMRHCQPVSCRKNAVLPRRVGVKFERLFRFLTIGRIISPLALANPETASEVSLTSRVLPHQRRQSQYRRIRRSPDRRISRPSRLLSLARSENS